MSSKPKILAVSGSTRLDSSNSSILTFIKEQYATDLDVEIYEGIAKLPQFVPGIEGDNLPDEVRELQAQMDSADGLIICTPEYVFSLPGSLKNAIDWNVSTTLFSGKPTALIVASSLGEKAFEQLQLIMTTVEASIAKNSTLLISGTRGKIGKHGEIKDSETQTALEKLMVSLMKDLETKR